MSNAPNIVQSEDEDSDLTPPPPDGGWGWVVVFASFMIHIVTDGVTYSFGVFYDEFVTYFGEGKGATAWILSILVGMTLCSGPISSSFVNRWGCRVVTIAGSILASTCMIISCFANNVTTLYFTVGIGTGIGFGLIYLPAIVSVTMYFEKKRSLATGIAVCGSGFGTFVFAPVINLLLYEYGWRGAMLIIGAVILECIIFGALFRPLQYNNSRSDGKADHRNYIPLKPSEASTDVHISEENTLTIASSNDKCIKIQRPRSMGHFAATKSNKNLNSEKNGGIPSDITQSLSVRLAASHPVLSLSTSHSEVKIQTHYGSQTLKRIKPLSRPDIFYQGSLVNIPNHRSQNNIKLREDDNLLNRRSSTNSKHSRRSTHSKKKCSAICGIAPCSEETRETLKEMLDFSLLKDPIFIVFLLSNFFTSIGFNVPYVYIVSKAKTMGISSEKASMLLSVIGIANTIGRVVLGYISDNPKVNRLLIYNLCLTICGLATALSAFCIDFYTLALYGTIFGFTIGAYVGLTSVILVDLLGLENLTNAFGLLLLFQGIASLIGPPIVGELYDFLQSYDPGFYVAGVTISISGIILFAIPPLQKWQQGKKSKMCAFNNI